MRTGVLAALERQSLTGERIGESTCQCDAAVATRLHDQLGKVAAEYVVARYLHPLGRRRDLCFGTATRRASQLSRMAE